MNRASRIVLVSFFVARSALAGSSLGAGDRATVQVCVAALSADPFADKPLRDLISSYRRGPGLAALAAEYQKRTAAKPVVEDLIVLGRVEMERGQKANALHHLERAAALTKEPSHLRALGDLLFEAGDRGAATLAYQGGRAGATPAELRKIQVRLGALLLGAGKLADARNEWAAAKRSAPSDLTLRRQIAEALGVHGDWANAIAELRELEPLLEKDPAGLITILRREAEFARRTGDEKLARETLLKAYALASRTRQNTTRNELTTELFRAYRADATTPAPRRTRGLDELAEAGQQISSEDARAAALQGDVLNARGDLAGAIVAFRRSLDASPGDTYVLRRLCAIESGENRVRDLKALFEIDVNDVSVGLDLVTALFSFKRAAEAIQHAEALKARYMDSALVLSELAHVLSLNSAHSQAVVLYERVLELDANQPDLVLAYGDALRAMGRTSEAAKVYFRLVQKDRSEASYRRLIDALQHRRLLDELMRAYKEALEKSPESQTLRRDYARWLSSTGKYDEAIAAWQAIAVTAREPFLKDFAAREIKRIEQQKLFKR